MNNKQQPITEYTLTNGSYSICYTLIEEQVKEDGDTRPSFSLTVKRGDEFAVMEDFTHIKEKALPILELFCRQAVLPEELPDLAEDLLSDFEFVQ